MHPHRIFSHARADKQWQADKNPNATKIEHNEKENHPGSFITIDHLLRWLVIALWATIKFTCHTRAGSVPDVWTPAYACIYVHSTWQTPGMDGLALWTLFQSAGQKQQTITYVCVYSVRNRMLHAIGGHLRNKGYNAWRTNSIGWVHHLGALEDRRPAMRPNAYLSPLQFYCASDIYFSSVLIEHHEMNWNDGFDA